MREIKFRAWDKKTKQMIFTGFHLMGEVMAFNQIEGYIFKHMEGASSSLERWNDIETMQYTGLKDKNGKQIYEGDIVRLCEEGNFDISVVVFYPHQASFMFRWASCWKDEDDFMHADYPSQLHPDRVSREVIGNIWENPELLENDG